MPRIYFYLRFGDFNEYKALSSNISKLCPARHCKDNENFRIFAVQLKSNMLWNQIITLINFAH